MLARLHAYVVVYKQKMRYILIIIKANLIVNKTRKTRGKIFYLTLVLSTAGIEKKNMQLKYHTDSC